MSVVLELPTELEQFLGRDVPESVVLRGPPGSGKTTLGLALLSNFHGRRILVSSRVSEKKLRADHPWIAGESGLRLVESNRRRGGLANTGKALEALGRLVQDPESEESMRSLWLPDSLQETWSEVATGGGPAMVVIDSWDALVEQYVGVPSGQPGLPDRSAIERLLLDQMATGPIFLVLIVEHVEPTQLDYLVNAVVELESVGTVNRLYRWLHLRKLRGTRIESPAYPFTLEEGRFRCITPLPARFTKFGIRPEPAPNQVEGYLWPGCADFAAAFGRLPVGRITLIEYDLGVPVEAGGILARPAAGDVVLRGGRALHILPPNVSPAEVWDAYRALISRDQFLRQVRLQPTGVSYDIPEEIAPAILPPPVEDGSPIAPRTPEAVRFMREPNPGGVPNISFVWTAALRAFSYHSPLEYTPQTLPAIAMAYLGGAPAHTIFLGGTADPLIESLREIAGIRIHLTLQSGRVFVQGEQPATAAYLLTESGHEDRPYGLLRIA